MSGLTADERRALETAARIAVAYREGMDTAPVPPALRPDRITPRFRVPLPDSGQPADEVIADMAETASDGICAMSAGRFFAYVLGGSMPVGVAADMLVSAWGQNVGSSWETPSAHAMEKAVADWCLGLMGLPEDAAVGFVTGATVANTQGIMAARHALLKAQGWDVEARGLFGAPEIPVLIGEDAHSAPFAGLRYAGLGAGRVRRIAADDQGRMKVDDVMRALDETAAPPLVITQAGQINTGAFDPFCEIVPAVHDRGGWVHVDGAFALWVAAVPELRHRLDEVETADSWAVDLHKWLNAPFDAGLAIVRDAGPLIASMSARGAYLPTNLDDIEPTDVTVELSRRARGVPSYAILKHLGKSGVRELVARHCGYATDLAARLATEPGITVVNEVASNQVAIRMGEGETGDAATMAVLDRIHERGRVYPSHGEWRGRTIIRNSIIGYATSTEDIRLLGDEIVAAWRAVRETVA